MFKCFKRRKQEPMPDDNNRVSYFTTVIRVKTLGFCHWYLWDSNLFRASFFGFK